MRCKQSLLNAQPLHINNAWKPNIRMEWVWWSVFSQLRNLKENRTMNKQQKQNENPQTIKKTEEKNWVYSIAIPDINFWLISMDLWIMNTRLKSCGVTIVLRVMVVVQLRLCERIISQLCLQKSFDSWFVTMRLIKKA